MRNTELKQEALRMISAIESLMADYNDAAIGALLGILKDRVEAFHPGGAREKKPGPKPSQEEKKATPQKARTIRKRSRAKTVERKQKVHTLLVGDPERANPGDNPDDIPKNGRVLMGAGSGTKLSRGHYNLSDYEDAYTRGILARLVRASERYTYVDIGKASGVSAETARSYANLRQLNPLTSTLDKIERGLKKLGA